MMSRHEAQAALTTATTGWFKASGSGGQNGCVEVNFAVPGYVGIRDSKLGDKSPVLVVTRAHMDTFLRVIR